MNLVLGAIIFVISHLLLLSLSLHDRYLIFFHFSTSFISVISVLFKIAVLLFCARSD